MRCSARSISQVAVRIPAVWRRAYWRPALLVRLAVCRPITSCRFTTALRRQSATSYHVTKVVLFCPIPTGCNEACGDGHQRALARRMQLQVGSAAAALSDGCVPSPASAPLCDSVSCHHCLLLVPHCRGTCRPGRCSL